VKTKTRALVAIPVLSLALWGLQGPNALAASCTDGPNDEEPADNSDTDDLATVPVTGTKVYGGDGDGDQTTVDGGIGVGGSTGYLETDGDGETGSIEGHNNATGLDGRIDISGDPSVCVNEQTLP
jgi:hypothetical protein